VAGSALGEVPWERVRARVAAAHADSFTAHFFGRPQQKSH
jgi:hypothetical protein